MRLFTKIKFPLIVLLGLLFTVNAKAQLTFTFSSPTVDSSNVGYTLTGVGAYYKSSSRNSISTGNIGCNGTTISASGGGSGFIFETYVSGIVGIIVYGEGTGSNRTLTSVATSTSINGTYTTLSTAASADVMESSSNCDSLLITTGTPISAGTFMQFTFSGNINVSSIVLLSSSSFTAPTVITALPSSITFNSATVGGNVTGNGNAAIISRGILYGTSANPQIGDGVSTQIADPSAGTGTYSASLTGLTPSTVYHVQAYATNAIGTSYGGDSTFTTPAATPTVVSNPSSLGFGTVSVDSSFIEGFALSGTYLNANDAITVTAPASGYTVSLNPAGPFSSSVQIPYTGQTLTSTTVYVQFVPTLSQNYIDSLTLTGGGIATQYVALSGAGTTASLGVTKGFSNVGNDFWTGFGASEKMFNGIDGNNAPVPNGGDGSAGGASGSGDPSSNPDILFTFNNPTTVDAHVTIAIPGIPAFTPVAYTVPAGTQFTTPAFIIPQSGAMDARLDSEGVSNNGIHITSDTDIVVFQHAYTKQVYAASLLLPTPTLGKQYTSLNYTQLSNSNVGRSYCFGVATDTGTTVVQVTLPPNVSTQTHAAGTMFTDTLQQGEVLNLFGAYLGSNTGVDLSGVVFNAFGVDGASCKKLAFFSGSSKIGIGCTGTAPSTADNLFQQVFPSQVWGYKYVTVPTSNFPINKFRILINNPATNVSVDGGAVPITLDPSGTFYEFTNSDQKPHVIIADKPIMVAEYITNPSQCGNPGGNGDADMVYLSSIQQGINSVSLVSSQGFGADQINTNFINVAIKTNIVNTFKLDGVPSGSSFAPVPYDPTYSFAQFPVSVGTHTLSSADSGFVATAYGFASAVSYAYNAGTNLQDLVHRSVSQNTLGAAGTSALPCRNAPFVLSVTLPYTNPAYVIWNFSNNPLLTPSTPDTMHFPAPVDSILNTDGTQLYVFRDTVPHVFSIIGSFNFNVIAQDPTADGCASQTISFKQLVDRGPTADFTFPSQVANCPGAVTFTDASQGAGGTLYKWVWNYGDATPISTDSTIQNPTHPYTAGGNHTVSLRVFTQEGCYADTSKVLTFGSTTAPIFSRHDSTICAGSTVVAFPTTSDNGIAGTWNPASINTNATKTYLFTPTSGCSSDTSFTITVTQKTNPAFATIDPVCSGGTITLPTTSVNSITGSWSPGIDNQHTTLYTFTPSSGCAKDTAITVQVIQKPSITVSSDSTLITAGTQIALTGTSDVPFAAYAWTSTPAGFNSTDSATVDNPTQTTTYALTVSNSSNGTTCSTSGTVKVTVQSGCAFKPYKFFTPNGDGANDTWFITTGGCIIGADVSVYNRWGGLVYHSDNYANDWNGTYKGNSLPDGTYYYVILVKLPGNNFTSTYTGNVTIIR